MEITIGKYTLSKEYDETEELWLTGPDGDGMELNKETEAKLEKVIEAFFKENM